MTHITHKTAKMLKEFLGKDAPEPMEKAWWIIYHGKPEIFYGDYGVHHDQFPAYQLHDLLSKPFCEAMAKAGTNVNGEYGERRISRHLSEIYFDGGLPAVEKALIQMMEEK